MSSLSMRVLPGISAILAVMTGCALPDLDVSACRTAADCLEGDTCENGICYSPGENRLPAVHIVSPQDGALVPAGTLVVEATASDPDGQVSEVVFELPGKTARDTDPPYLVGWDASDLTDGFSASLSATAFDDRHAPSPKDSVLVTIVRNGCLGSYGYDFEGVPFNVGPFLSEEDMPAIEVRESGLVKQMDLSLLIRHPDMSMVGILLMSPIETIEPLHQSGGDPVDQLELNVHITTFEDENSQGTWTLVLLNLSETPATLVVWSMTMELCVSEGD